MNQTLTVRLDAELARQLDRACALGVGSRSELAREALRRFLTVKRFEQVRAALVPYAEDAGYYLDEDVFRDVS